MGSDMDEYVSSKAMITPGIAGSATTMITGTLVSQFDFPGANTALAISFIFGLLIFGDKAVALSIKFVLYLVHSMTIFSVAVGLNQAGIAIVEKDKEDQVIERKLLPEDEVPHQPENKEADPFFQNWF